MQKAALLLRRHLAVEKPSFLLGSFLFWVGPVGCIFLGIKALSNEITL